MNSRTNLQSFGIQASSSENMLQHPEIQLVFLSKGALSLLGMLQGYLLEMTASPLSLGFLSLFKALFVKDTYPFFEALVLRVSNLFF